MRWWIPLFIALGVSPAFGEQFAITDFKGGLNSNYSPLTIADNEVQDALNVYFDEENAAVKRQGFDVCGSSKSYSYDSAWSYRDSGRIDWLIVRSSENIIASNEECNFEVVIATVGVNDLVNATVALGSIWFTDVTQGVYYWNGTSTTYVSGSPRGSLIANYRERICVAGLNIPNNNDIYCSAYLDGTNWSTSSTLSTGAILIRVGLSDFFDSITAIYSGYNDSMQIFKNRSVYGLYGTDKTDFLLRVLTTEAGCVDGRTVQPYLGGLVFASERGIEFFNGVQVQTPPISDKIDNLLENVRPSSLNSASWSVTTESDFLAGSISPSGTLSASISPGSVIQSTHATTVTSDADWSAGNLALGSLDASGGSLIVKDNVGAPATTFTGGFESDFGWVPSLGRIGSSASGCTLSPAAGSWFIGTTNSQATITIKECSSGTSLGSLVISRGTANCSWSEYTSGSIPMNKKHVKVEVDRGGGTVNTSSCTIAAGTTFTTQAAFNNTVIGLDELILRSYQSQTHTYTSQVFDTGLSSPIIQAQFSRTIDDITPSFVLQHSTSSVGTWVNLTTSSGTNHWGNRYVRFLSTFTFVELDGGDILSSVDEVTIIARSTGTYYSEVHYAPDFSSWLQMNPTYSSNGGTHSFFVRASTNSYTVLSSTPAWTSVQPNTQITASTGTYIQFKDSFTVTTATAAPSLDSVRISWIEGSRRNPMASITIDNRYYLSLSTTTDSNENTATLVLSPGPVWSIFNIGAGAFLKHVNSYYFSNASGNGKVNTFLVGLNDAGSPISAFVKTKDYALGDITKNKLFDSLYLITDSKSGSDIDTSYTVNRSTTSYSLHSLSLTSTDGILSEKLNFPLSYPNFGKTINFRFGNDDLDEGMHLYGGILNYRIRRTE